MSYKIVIEKIVEEAEQVLEHIDASLKASDALGVVVKEIREVSENGEVQKTFQEIQHIVEQNSQASTGVTSAPEVHAQPETETAAPVETTTPAEGETNGEVAAPAEAETEGESAASGLEAQTASDQTTE